MHSSCSTYTAHTAHTLLIQHILCSYSTLAARVNARGQSSEQMRWGVATNSRGEQSAVEFVALAIAISIPALRAAELEPLSRALTAAQARACSFMRPVSHRRAVRCKSRDFHFLCRLSVRRLRVYCKFTHCSFTACSLPVRCLLAHCSFRNAYATQSFFHRLVREWMLRVFFVHVSY